MKTRILFSVLVLALSAGCSTTLVRRTPEGGLTVFRGSLGADQSLGELLAEDGKGAKLQIKRHTNTQTEGLGRAVEGAVKGVKPGL